MNEADAGKLLNLRWKYGGDRLLALAIIILAAPLLAIILLAQCLERLVDKEAHGPFFLTESRISRDRCFPLYKFNTLRRSVLLQMEKAKPLWHYQQDRANRTRVGHVLVLFYLDELPQLWNILLGHMSFVGPRPKTPHQYQGQLRKGYRALKYLKGGLTGPYQLLKGSADFQLERSEEYYVKCKKSSSLGLLLYDASILLRSVFKLLKAEGL